VSHARSFDKNCSLRFRIENYLTAIFTSLNCFNTCVAVEYFALF
jgi:hypothetical protein